MKYDQKDNEFQEKIISVLFDRHMINANKEIGAAYLQPETEDKVNPKVVISGNELKENTGREKLRDSVYDQYIQALNQHPLVTAERLRESIIVSVNPVRSPDNEYSSIADLEKRNNEEVDEDPSLGEPQW